MSSSSAESVLGAGGELQGVRSCTHSNVSREGLSVLLFDSTDPQKEVCLQRHLWQLQGAAATCERGRKSLWLKGMRLRKGVGVSWWEPAHQTVFRPEEAQPWCKTSL